MSATTDLHRDLEPSLSNPNARYLHRAGFKCADLTELSSIATAYSAADQDIPDGFLAYVVSEQSYYLWALADEEWIILGGDAEGDVVGPGAGNTTQDALARWTGGGNELADSGVLLDDSNNISGAADVGFGGNLVLDADLTQDAGDATHRFANVYAQAVSGAADSLTLDSDDDVLITAGGAVSLTSTTTDINLNPIAGNVYLQHNSVNVVAIGSTLLDLVGWQRFNALSAPSTPSAGKGYVYQKTGSANYLYYKGESGTEYKVVLHDTADLVEGSNLYFTDERAQDAIGTILTDSATVDFTYSDATPSITAAVIPGGIKLDDLGTPDDNTDLNASTSAHGLLRKLSNNSYDLLTGDGNWTETRFGHVTQRLPFREQYPLMDTVNQLYVFTSGRAVFVYVGYTVRAFEVNRTYILNQNVGSGAQTAEMGLFSTPNSPDTTGQTLTCLVASGSIDALTSGSVLRGNTSAYAYTVAANVHLWVGMRVAMATSQPQCRSVATDWLDGRILTTNSASVFAATNTYTGVVPSLNFFTAEAPRFVVR